MYEIKLSKLISKSNLVDIIKSNLAIKVTL